MTRSNIQISEKDIRVLKALARFYVLSAPLMKRICFGEHRGTRATRDRVARLKKHGYIFKSAVEVSFGTGNAGPVYTLTSKGSRLLATWFDDDQYLAINTRPARTDRLYHWLAISETHWQIEQAIAAQSLVSLDGWVNEWEVINKEGAEAEQISLHTHLRENPPLSCSPDAGFLLTIGDASKVVYLEQDRATTDPRRVAASKVKGYAELYRRQWHQQHFPATTLSRFTVLLVTTDAKQRNAIAKAVSTHTNEEPGLWLFVDRQELMPATFLHEPITYNCQLEAGPLVTHPDDARARA